MNRNDQIYIKMCKSSSIIQKNWKPSNGDYYFSEADKHIHLVTGKIDKKYKFWLPTEHQLSKLGIKFGVLNWMKFDQLCAEFWDYFTNLNKEHPTKKMCGAAAIMRLAENKFWQNNEWCKL
jgi:hypothetical protein